MELRPLRLTDHPAPDARGAGTRMASPWWKVSPAVKDTVCHRDLHVCAFCGFRSRRYQEVVVLGSNPRDVDRMVTACQFCHQCLHLSLVADMRSGVLIWFPELSQRELHHVARELYLARITHHAGARAQAVLDTLLQRREEAARRLGSDDPRELAARLAAPGADRGQVLPPELEAGLRLLPLDRRILRERGLEYNQFPQILAYWRSPAGPCAGMDDWPWLDAFEQATRDDPQAREARLQAERRAQESPPPPSTHAALAAKLLRDAAIFFLTLADSNEPIEAAMRGNASVYRQMADLLETDPMADLGTDPDNESGDQRTCTVAARLLRDAADFFESVGRENLPLLEQMDENARVFRQLAQLLDEDPLGGLDLGS